ncbi:copper resistance protein B [Sphingomonas sp. PL20]|uniref:copper resistance protein B n=1 Tax=Sphingomonas sp. PL20 TaxID=2760712 RepID=UPI001AE30ADB
MWFIMAAAAAAAASTPAAPQTVEVPAGPPAPQEKDVMERQIEMGGMGHEERTFTYNRIEADYSRQRGKNVGNYDAEGWVGGDRDKFWYKSEGEKNGPRTEQLEFQALYSRNVFTYFDVQGGVRYDVKPDSRGYAVFGIQGLSPYRLETQVHAFVGFKGDVSIRYKQSFDLLMTNRLIVAPTLETDFYLNDAPGRRVKSGFSVIETGVQTRYEFSRKFAPYVAVVYESKLGGTARLARLDGENAGGWALRTGIRAWF